MDSVFSNNEVVQALDTEIGVWTEALIEKIDGSTVHLDFYKCASNNKFRRITVVVPSSLIRDQPKWPIRKPVQEDLSGKRTNLAKIHIGYNPEHKIIGDWVHIIGEGGAKVAKRVALNDPYLRTLVLVDADHRVFHYDSATQSFPWSTVVGQTATLYTALVAKPISDTKPRTQKHSQPKIKLEAAIFDPDTASRLLPRSAHITVASDIAVTTTAAFPDPRPEYPLPERKLVIAPCINGTMAVGDIILFMDISFTCIGEKLFYYQPNNNP